MFEWQKCVADICKVCYGYRLELWPRGEAGEHARVIGCLIASVRER